MTQEKNYPQTPDAVQVGLSRRRVEPQRTLRSAAMSQETLFQEALGKPAGERAAFLAVACAGQPELRAAVEAQLAAQEGPSSLLGGPSARTDQPIDSEPVSVQVVTTTDYHPPIEPGLIVAGRYTPAEKIGEGGMGEVWIAKQTEPVKRKVALKLIKTGMDSKAVLQRFEQERQALALMDHPNISRVLDGGLTPTGQPFFVMELVSGLPLTRFCDASRLTPRQRLELFVPICQAVQHAHQKGIIHRDLKPANILVTIIDGKPVPKVIDFGMAKATAGKLTDESLSTQFGAVIGTLEYMAPEQAGYAGEDIDTRADIYSLGVILYELLTGLRPLDAKRYQGMALTEMVRIIREEEPSKPSKRLSTEESLPPLAALRQTEPKKLMALLRGELDWVVMKCLEKQRDRRYETANGLARDIQRYLADEPVEARPPSASYRLGKFLRRNKGPVLAASLVLLALVAGMVGTTLGMLHAERRRVEAEHAQKREAEQRDKAEKARDRTRQALDTMTSSVTGDSLTTQKAISAEQKKFLTEVLSYYREFAGEKADDELSRARTAAAARRVGTIEYRLGRKKEAADAIRQACDSYEQLASDFPAVPEYRNRLSGSQCNLAILLADLGRESEAEQQYRKALALQEKLAAEYPDLPQYRMTLANTQINLGKLLRGLGKLPEAEQQYRKALDLLEKLTGDHPALPQYRKILAASHNHLGSLLTMLGKLPEAEQQYRKALDLLEKLTGDHPALPEYRYELADSHNHFGNLLIGMGKQLEAEQQYRKALALQEKLATEYPAVPGYRQDLAKSHYSLAFQLRNQRKRSQAEQHYRMALDLQEKLAAEYPDQPEYRLDLAKSHNGFGLLLAGMGKQLEAEQQHRMALDLQEKLAADFPAVPQYRIDLGGSYCNFGVLLYTRNRPSESVPWFEKAIRSLTAVHQQNPQLVVAKQYLRNSHTARARTYARLRQYAEAIKDWDKAIELTPPAEQPRYRAPRAMTYLRAGQVSQSVAEVAELTKSTNWKANQWYDFACVYAVASGKVADKKQEYAERAMELLQKAVKAGYSDAAHMQKDSDLDSLRGRDDFKKLMQQLANGRSP
jgi:serine/threonine protein kinase/Tfp pilus assembly protein PilF